MRTFTTLGALLAALVLTGGAAVAATNPVGQTDLTVPGDTALRGDPSNRLQVVVWYPAVATARMTPIVVGAPGKPLFQEGEAARDAAPAAAPSRLPLIVVSHGTGGTNMDLSWLCAGLAAHGYIVAAVLHPGNNALAPETVQGATLWWQRAGDLTKTIDGVLADKRFGPLVDRRRIGAAGFSIGGATVLIAAGARSSYAALDDYCKKNPNTPVCNGEATPGLGDISAKARELLVTDTDFRAAEAQADDLHRDVRIKAVFSIAPAVGPALIPESLHAITIPVEIVAGAGDPILPVGDNAIPDALAMPNATLTLLPQNVQHYTFLTDCTAYGAQQIPPICVDAGPGRLAVHHTTLELALAFFARTLAAPK
jgi:predicted dienelactone hydrolase